ncbi:MAG: acyl-CoA thioesterase [Mogibacterium sp.]|nr:acyl-CoA thioesterase [Mogibacterium sp.]
MKIYERTVNYYETDQMAVIHHSNYIRYFEEARISFMAQIGCPYEALEREEIRSPVLAVSCRYIQPVRFGETVQIRVRLTRMSRVKCSFSYEVCDAETGEIRARGELEHGFIDKDGRPVNMQKSKPEFFARFIAETESGDGAERQKA